MDFRDACCGCSFIDNAFDDLALAFGSSEVSVWILLTHADKSHGFIAVHFSWSETKIILTITPGDIVIDGDGAEFINESFKAGHVDANVIVEFDVEELFDSIDSHITATKCIGVVDFVFYPLDRKSV